MPSALIVEDEEHIRVSLAYSLRKAGYEVWTASSGGEALASVQQVGLDVILLDIMLPDLDGFEVCRRIRQQSNVPILMVTARADELDTVVGLELGADDYIAKPCELRELVARVRSVLRRSAAAASGAGGPPRTEPVRFGTKWLDFEARVLRDEEGIEHPLTTSEFNLLKAFAEHPRRVMTRERLLDLANARDPDAFDRAIDVRITRIRKKVEPDPNHPRIIRTVRGAGYVFSPEGQET